MPGFPTYGRHPYLCKQPNRISHGSMYFTRSHGPSCRNAEGIRGRLWLQDPAANPTPCSMVGLTHGLEMPPRVMQAATRPGSLPHNSAVHARGRICCPLAHSPEQAKRESPPPEQLFCMTRTTST